MTNGTFEDPTPSMDIAPGRFIIAAPGNTYGFLQRSVQLILLTEDGNAHTIVLGRMTDIPLKGMIDKWVPLAGKPHAFFQGGLSNANSVIGIAAAAAFGGAGVGGPSGTADGIADGIGDGIGDGSAGSADGFGSGFGIPLERCPSVGILQLTADPDDYIDTIGQARFFIGTTLMPLDTLRTGIEEGHFRLIDARPDLIFAPRTIDIWRECMRLLPGTAPLWSTHTPYGEN
ncbi:YqgE/AlgH family protein [Corynebacterium glucuronolyticum]|uniref:YqgE/AlgH family protein n=1 Tax=Corynebacterium glucuronolyticum TaxID=39791 RepID=UPI00223BCC5A|nr:YqgE/AlgH family protein [Corynebacterium glucuronolyticum]MCT1563271.1 YqgE/AlgH family protein [Corynebacterium glucuronolyticum]